MQAAGRTVHEKVLVKIRFFLFFRLAIDYILHAILTGFLISSGISKRGRFTDRRLNANWPNNDVLVGGGLDGNFVSGRGDV